MKLPKWFWGALIILCMTQWTVGIWIEVLTSRARDAFLVIVLISFIVYPIFSLITVFLIKGNRNIDKSYKVLWVILLVLGFITNPAVFHTIDQFLCFFC